MRAKAAEDLADEGDVAGAAIVQARNKFLTQVIALSATVGILCIEQQVLVLYLVGPTTFSMLK